MTEKKVKKPKAKFISDMNIDVIVFGGGINLILMRELFKENIIENYFFKSEVELILECIKNIMEREKKREAIEYGVSYADRIIQNINDKEKVIKYCTNLKSAMEELQKDDKDER